MNNKEKHEKMIQVLEFAKSLGLPASIHYANTEDWDEYCDSLSEVGEYYLDRSEPLSNGKYKDEKFESNVQMVMGTVSLCAEPQWDNEELDEEGFANEPDSYDVKVEVE